jgi:hypothetical protein
MMRCFTKNRNANAICLDQTECLLQAAITRRAHEAIVKLKEGRPPLAPPARSSGTTTDSKVFIGWDGKEHAYLITPEAFLRR